MSHVLSESDWLSNRNNAMKMLVWCIGSTFAASSFLNSINQYVPPPVTPALIRRIRSLALDHRKCRENIPGTLLRLASSDTGTVSLPLSCSESTASPTILRDGRFVAE